MKENEVVNAWVMFGYNYPQPSEFISTICAKCKKMYLVDHLLGKWRALYDTLSSRAVMNAFYSRIDADLQEALTEYALTWWQEQNAK